MSKFMIIDRDGVINEDLGYVGQKENFIFIENNLHEIKRLSNRYRPIIITNQSGIARGKYSSDDFLELSVWMIAQLKNVFEIEISDLYYCPHHPQFPKYENITECKCRKPGTLLFERAIEEHNINTKQSITIGDNLRDVIPGVKLGFKANYLINNDIINPHDRIKQITSLREVL